MCFCVKLTVLRRHIPLSLPIQFVAEYNKGELAAAAGPAIIHEAFAPAVQILQRDGVRNIVDEAAAVRPSVERVSERLELLLARCVPNLQRHHIIINNNFLLAEVSADRRLRILVDFAV